MGIREIAARSTATAVQAFTATLLAGSLIEDVGDVALWQRAAVSALAGVLTVAHRTAGAWLESRGDVTWR